MSNVVNTVTQAVYDLYKGSKKGGLRRLSKDLYGNESKHSSLAEYFVDREKKNISSENLAKIERDLIAYAVENKHLFPLKSEIHKALKELELVARLANFSTKKSKYKEWLEEKANQKLEEAKQSNDFETGLGIGAGALAAGGVAALFAGPIGLGIGAVVGLMSAAAGAGVQKTKLKESEVLFHKSQELREKFDLYMNEYKDSLKKSLEVVRQENITNQKKFQVVMKMLELEISKVGLPGEYQKETIKEFKELMTQVPTLENIFLIPSAEENKDSELELMVEDIFKTMLNEKS
jgi:hypothetical protein